MKTGPDGIALIKQFEGLRLKAYPDPGTGGEPWTIGYGTTSSAGVGKIAKGMVITKVQAESMLVRSLDAYERGVMKVLSKPPAQHQFDAMVSLAYNIGLGRFVNSTVVKAFNAGDFARAGQAFLLWNKAAGKVMPGLTRRRAAERDLFLKPDAVASAPPAGNSTAQ
ncbi:Endolysin/autolysin [uncultured Caudovirales phage]|uniref:Endolysin n=1 Tax=uncultured Caudovirales phage TaxID=2100421 RepID=A0A6J7VSQ6_9CAUD|nr:Endolysin/autolysin [uncultured Caudovirales phage]